MAAIDTDRIERKILLRAPRSRVWRALTDSQEFGKWFGVRLTGAFVPGARLRGPITTKGYEHLTMDLTIERVEPERMFSWRWPHAELEADKDYADVPTTLVVFELDEVDGGTLLTVVESGFDRIPLAQRAEALRRNEGGWTAQMEAIARYVGPTA